MTSRRGTQSDLATKGRSAWPHGIGQTRQQVLTPLDDASLIETAHADENSIMCYQIPGSITKDGNPIIGGLDIDPSDYAFAGSLYPKPHHVAAHDADAGGLIYEDTAVIDIAGGEITRIALKKPVRAEGSEATN